MDNGWMYALMVSAQKDLRIHQLENELLKAENKRIRDVNIQLRGELDELYRKWNAQRRKMAHLHKDWADEQS